MSQTPVTRAPPTNGVTRWSRAPIEPGHDPPGGPLLFLVVRLPDAPGAGGGSFGLIAGPDARPRSRQDLAAFFMPPDPAKTPSGAFQMPQATHDLRIRSLQTLSPPCQVAGELPATSRIAETVGEARAAVHRILAGRDDRLVVVIGPCSIHDPGAALDYARRLAHERTRHAGELEILMRVYFEKPRSTVGWKGLINDPRLDGSFRIDEGLRLARRLLLEINALDLPAACEFR